MTLNSYYKNFKKELEEIYSSSESENIADWVFENITGLKKGRRHLDKDEVVLEEIRLKLEAALTRLKSHEPVQYVLKESWFYKEKFLVTQDVLIPRPETEELVSWILNITQSADEFSIIDIGTGSGCIPIIIKKYRPNSFVRAIDVSQKALAVAKINASKLNSDVDLIQLDFLFEDNWKDLGTFDIIISNPPYIPLKERSTLQRNVRDFEPSLALFVEDNDPLLFYRKIIEFSKLHLTNGGKVVVEVHENYCAETCELFKQKSFNHIEIKKDIYGKQRMILAIK